MTTVSKRLLTCLVLVIPSLTQGSWLTGYGYRAKIPVGGSAFGEMSGYQMKLVVYRETGLNTGGRIYLNDHSLSWPNDIRFTGSDGITLKPHFLRNATADTAVFYIRVDTPLSGTLDYWIYYGKQGDTSLSSGVNTFEFFDNFTGTHIDTDHWGYEKNPIPESEATTFVSVEVANSCVVLDSAGRTYFHTSLFHRDEPLSRARVIWKIVDTYQPAHGSGSTGTVNMGAIYPRVEVENRAIVYYQNVHIPEDTDCSVPRMYSWGRVRKSLFGSMKAVSQHTGNEDFWTFIRSRLTELALSNPREQWDYMRVLFDGLAADGIVDAEVLLSNISGFPYPDILKGETPRGWDELTIDWQTLFRAASDQCCASIQRSYDPIGYNEAWWTLNHGWVWHNDKLVVDCDCDFNVSGLRPWLASGTCGGLTIADWVAVAAFCNPQPQWTVPGNEEVSDTDSDGIPDTEDNCPSVANPDQIDSDLDGMGNPCDNCPGNFNPFQLDSDQDQIGDACDNCPFDYNPSQRDDDEDQVGNACDNCTTTVILVVSPGGDESWCTGESVDITWTSENTSGTVKIDHSTDNGATWRTVSSSLPDDGSHTWRIPDTPSWNCLIRICDELNTDCCGRSRSAFSICDFIQAHFTGNLIQSEDHTCLVQFADQSTGICITNWSWDFGDGNVSDQQDPSHTYDRGSIYSVSLTISGPCGSNSEVKEDYIACECLCGINVISPDGGERWCLGEIEDITWASEYTSGNVRIDYSTDNGSTWKTVSGSTPDDGSYPWTTPDNPTAMCRIRICDPSDADCCGRSSSPFALCDAPQADFTGEPTQSVGQTCTIQFADQSFGVCITRWSWDFGDGTKSDFRDPSHTYTCGGSYSVNLTVSGPCGSDSEIKENYIVCECPCEINVLSPNGGEIWCAGEIENITWSSQRSSDTVRIDYSTDNGATWQIISDKSPDTGEYHWTIPSTPSEECLVQICDAFDPECFGQSHSTFILCDFPQADFRGNPIQHEGYTCNVQFTDLSSEACITGWSWDFGDTAGSSQQHPAHTYSCGRAYPVRLTISGSCGSDSVTKENYIACECPCGIIVTSPRGGERWCFRENQQITWASEYSSEAVKIDYSSDGGRTWNTISASSTNDGTHDWTIPQTPSIDCNIRVCDAADSTCCGLNDSSFQICECEAIEIVADSLPFGTEGCLYEEFLSTVGGCLPFYWSIITGQLPEGLSLENSMGILSGRLKEVGHFNVEFTVIDALGNFDEEEFFIDIIEYTNRKGDLNHDCEINIVEALLVVNIILERTDPTEDQTWCADCNGPPGNCEGDGLVNIMDVLKIVNIILELDSCPPFQRTDTR